MPHPQDVPCASPRLSPAEVARLQALAEALRRGSLDGKAPPMALRGKQLGALCALHDDASLALFRRAAQALGAHVAVMPASLSPASTPQEVLHTARLLGRLYDAVECQGLPATLVQQIGLHAGIPVYDGIATPAHPSAALAERLGSGDTPGDARHFVLQAVLIDSLG